MSKFRRLKQNIAPRPRRSASQGGFHKLVESLARENQRALAMEAGNAPKFIFESNDDYDDDSVKAIFETTQAMGEFGLLTLPYEAVLIEDPVCYEKLSKSILPKGMTQQFETTQYYLCRQMQDHIEVIGFTRVCYPVIGLDKFIFFLTPRILQFDALDWEQDRGTPIIAVREFLFALATKQSQRVSVPGRSPGQAGDLGYAYTIVTVSEVVTASGQRLAGNGPKRRLHPVRGYIWGRNTRPLEEQRWIAPFYRGDCARGVVSHEAYRVNAVPAEQLAT